jgi:hypothetical protein
MCNSLSFLSHIIFDDKIFNEEVKRLDLTSGGQRFLIDLPKC